MKKELTERQKKIFEFIKDFIDSNGYPPTYREIGTNFQISSTFGVKRHIDALLKKGYINIDSNASRTLSISKMLINKDISRSYSTDFVGIPLLGRVAAGSPILAEENIEGTLKIDASLIKRYSNSFGLRVRGDSMVNAGIYEGDIVIVESTQNVINDDIIVALLGQEATLKKYRNNNSEISLIPENENYSEIKVINREDFSIIGKVVGLFRTYN